jgi:hypothetical protein
MATPPRFSLRTVLTLVAVACVACAAIVLLAPRAPTLPELFGGAKNLALVRQPEKVVAHRLADIPYEEIDEHTMPWDFKPVGEAVEAPPEVAKRVAKALTTRESYRWDDAVKACGWPTYGVRLDFISGKRRIEVYFCFRCGDLAVVENGRRLGGRDFGPSQDQLAREMKAIFPNDEVIQALSE